MMRRFRPVREWDWFAAFMLYMALIVSGVMVWAVCRDLPETLGAWILGVAIGLPVVGLVGSAVVMMFGEAFLERSDARSGRG